MRLGVGFPYFVTDHKQLAEVIRALDSIAPHVSRIYAIDGRFKEFPGERGYSIHGVNQVLQATYPNIQIVGVCANQLTKRQMYLDMAGNDNCDYLMVMDSEEYVHPDHANWSLFYEELEQHYDEEDYLYFMWFWCSPKWECSANPVTMETWQKYIRIHKHPGRQKYHMNHYTWRLKEDNSVNLNSLLCKKTLGGIKLTGDSVHRSRDFLDKKKVWEYQDMLVEQRRAWIAVHKLEELSNLLFTNKGR